MDKFIFDLDYTLYNRRDNINAINTHMYYDSFFKKPFLKHLLSELKKDYYLFTNGNSSHADFVLNKMDINKFFPDKKIMARDKMDNLLKPDLQTYERAINQFNICPIKDSVYFFEDTIENLQTSKKHFGWNTILIGDYKSKPVGVDYIFPHIEDALLFFLFTNKKNNRTLLT